MKRFKIKTLGCKVNQYETQLIRERLVSDGYQEAEDSQRADLCIVNTCTVTQKADKESRSALRHFIKENPDAEIIAAGCYADADPVVIKAIDSRIKVVGNEDKLKTADITSGRDLPLTLTLSPERERESGISYFKEHTKAFIKIQDGCNNFCSYCKVPYVRGRSKSREPGEIIEEATRLIGNGYRELILTGICIGDFGKDLKEGIDLTALIKRISCIEGDFRIRISSIELPDVTDDLIDEMAHSAKLCRHLHIPLQSGDDYILKKMNRRYRSSEFINRIEYIRSYIPDIGITTDVIVGFPYESEKNFENTKDILTRIRPSRSHIFTYSPRRETESFEMEDNIPQKIKEIRYTQLKSLTDGFTEEFKLRSASAEHRILVEKTRDKDTKLLTGYTDTYIKICLDGPDELIGRLIKVHLSPAVSLTKII